MSDPTRLIVFKAFEKLSLFLAYPFGYTQTHIISVFFLILGNAMTIMCSSDLSLDLLPFVELFPFHTYVRLFSLKVYKVLRTHLTPGSGFLGHPWFQF